MNFDHLIAPEYYKLTSELEVYKEDDQRIAIRWMDDQGSHLDVSYKELSTKK
ncbi:hypothetical protein ACFO0S_10240 [Chryseomicrobium palamuruense]|uniref:Uncharacterized protein n=1 Tax=Chryseomicrobium palamuruense TaxID=682973 RepID=A0ABV8UXY2_9BACL